MIGRFQSSIFCMLPLPKTSTKWATWKIGNKLLILFKLLFHHVLYVTVGYREWSISKRNLETLGASSYNLTWRKCYHWTQVSCPLNASQDDFHQQDNVPFLLSVSVCPHKGALHFLHSDLTACVFWDQDIFQPFCCHLTPPFSRLLSFSQWHIGCDKKKRKAISRYL